MKVKVRLAKTHAPIFVGTKNGTSGKNLKDTLISGGGLGLEYDTDQQELLVTWEGVTTHVVGSTVISYEPAIAGVVELPKQTIEHKSSRVSAQVSGPHDHVFQGEGKGLKRNK